MTQRFPLHLLNISLQNHPFASSIITRQFLHLPLFNSKIFDFLTCKQGKNRERTSKTGSADN
ncbi:Phosphopantetheine adenylyltransferase [Gossypium australe]|uniref:Mitochondria isoform 1 n=1 Tax=Gossypium australe TaxID=47621 RepID=A0A5B6WRW3_9ROSI|nr:Mitochondria isoform 1 [Gossypium australe]KAA3457008.1 Mitochondria isoform 1 [Gossypium australe]KAA3483637.1 Phosphopantetheine adenylyltransferase [Gossypium australe]KAA3483638.1 Phosphopantetheine adenylyltransferase [Gossypium australe]KAA3483640.1 Phosphopantetheine adenylyltransferase [Gossypium australe]